MTGVVYFLQHGETGPIKIGFTTASVYCRITQLQACSPDVLHCRGVEQADKSREQELHLKFARLRHRGEWFRAEAPLTNYLNKRFPGFGQADLDCLYWRSDLIAEVRAVRGTTRSSIDRFEDACRAAGLRMNINTWMRKEQIPVPFPAGKLRQVCRELRAQA